MVKVIELKCVNFVPETWEGEWPTPEDGGPTERLSTKEKSLIKTRIANVLVADENVRQMKRFNSLNMEHV